MKVILILLALVSTSVLADPSWVSVPNVQAKVDTSIPIAEDGFNGYRAWISLPNSYVTKTVSGQTITIVSEYVVIEYNCHTGVARARRVAFIEADGTVHNLTDSVWLNVNASPATDILDVVKARVCFHAY